MPATAKISPNMESTTTPWTEHNVREVRCIAVIWARHASRQNVSHRILDDLMETNGVKRAVFSRQNPDLLVVDYNPHQTRIAAILDVVEYPGVSARVVGC